MAELDLDGPTLNTVVGKLRHTDANPLAPSTFFTDDEGAEPARGGLARKAGLPRLMAIFGFAPRRGFRRRGGGGEPQGVLSQLWLTLITP
jgi:hypothetical protein